MKNSGRGYQRSASELLVNPMPTPATRAEFERNLYLLRERFRQGRIAIAPSISTGGLMRLRSLPNGRIDFLSVDEAVRLQANMMAQMESPMNPPETDQDDTAEAEPER